MLVVVRGSLGVSRVLVLANKLADAPHHLGLPQRAVYDQPHVNAV